MECGLAFSLGETGDMFKSIMLVTGYWQQNNKSAVQSALKLINILKSLSSQILWEVTNQIVEDSNPGVRAVSISTKFVEGSPPKVAFYMLVHQIKLSVQIIKGLINSRSEALVFAFGADLLPLPILVGRLAGHKVVLRTDGRPSYVLKMYYPEVNRFRLFILAVLERTSYALANLIVPESEYMVSLYGFKQYSSKVLSGTTYVDEDVFCKRKDLSGRKYDVGFIGRFSKEKGILEFIRSIPLIRTAHPIKAVMVGGGDLEGEVERILVDMGIQADVVPWATSPEIAELLNDTRVLIVPSYKEGLPNIVLEAMACGTVVVATAVGGIPGVVRNGETGIILENNSPECIARTIGELLENSVLEKLAQNAQALINKDYAFVIAVQRYRDIFAALVVK
jgi:glycosyltransferase involved in cell wall biosynthesis